MATDATPRRELKKQRTHDAIRAAAQRLFAEQGYAGTTVEQIAEAADVSPRTFFRYFESKDDLLLPNLHHLVTTIEAAVRARPVDEPPLEAVHQALRTILTFLLNSGALSAATTAVDPANPALAARIVKAFLTVEDRLADVMAQRRLDAGLAPTSNAALLGTIDAFVAIALVRVAARTARGWIAEGRTPSPAEAIALLDEVFDQAPPTRAGRGAPSA